MLVSASPFAAEASLPVAEVEPNNTLDQATPTGLADFGVAIISPAEIGNDLDDPFYPPGTFVQDYYRFTVVEATETNPVLVILAASADDPMLDLHVRLVDADDRNLMFNNDMSYPDNLNPLLQCYITQPGEYFAVVDNRQAIFSFGPPAGDPVPNFGLSYDLTISVTPGPANNDSIEPNDTAQDATLINGTNVTISNQFIGDGTNGRFDVDRFLMWVTPPAIVRATIETTNLELAEPLLSAVVPTGLNNFQELLHHASDATARTLEFLVLDVQGIPGERAVQFVVRGASTAPDAGDYSPIGFYDLQIDVHPLDPTPGVFEPNDSASQAIDVNFDAPGQSIFGGFIGDGPFAFARGDVDFYKVTLTYPGATLSVTMDDPPNPDNDPAPTVVLYDENLQIVDRQSTSLDADIHLSSLGSCPVVGDGDEVSWHYYIAVTGNSDRPTPDPTLPLDDDLTFFAPSAATTPSQIPPSTAFLGINGGPGRTGEYVIRIEAGQDENAPCGNEPDDTIDDANETSITDEGSFICSNGSLCDSDCGPFYASWDLFRITVSDPPRLLSTFVTSCNTPYAIRVFDDQGNDLALDSSAPTRSNELQIAADGIHYTTTLTEPGDYYVGVSLINDDYSPLEPCLYLDYCAFMPRQYSLGIELGLANRVPPLPTFQTATIGPPEETGRLFATLLDECADTIIEIDPESGQTINAIPAPQAPTGGREGLAFDGQHLYFMGTETAYPTLYKLDPDTGDIVDQVNPWFGSGLYGEMAFANGRLQILDMIEGSIHTLFPNLLTYESSTPITSPGLTDVVSAESVFGGMAHAIRPNSLLLNSGVDRTRIFVVDTTTGTQIDQLGFGASSRVCSCNGDLDSDGDVDADDQDILDECLPPNTPDPECENYDLNCDGRVDFLDERTQTLQRDDPDSVDRLIAECEALYDLGELPITTLAVTGPNTVYAADWIEPVLYRLNRTTNEIETMPVDAPLGSLTGEPPYALLADFDIDGDVDLLDFRRFQNCFDPTGNHAPSCESFDFTGDGRIKIADFGLFQEEVTGVHP